MFHVCDLIFGSNFSICVFMFIAIYNLRYEQIISPNTRLYSSIDHFCSFHTRNYLVCVSISSGASEKFAWTFHMKSYRISFYPTMTKQYKVHQSMMWMHQIACCCTIARRIESRIFHQVNRTAGGIERERVITHKCWLNKSKFICYTRNWLLFSWRWNMMYSMHYTYILCKSVRVWLWWIKYCVNCANHAEMAK